MKRRRDIVDAPAADRDRMHSVWKRISDNTAIRRIAIVLLVCCIWEAYAAGLQKPLIFPRLSETLAAWWEACLSGELATRVGISLKVLAIGYSTGIGCAVLLTFPAVWSRIGSEFLTTLTAMFSPLPAIALLPMAFLWFGLNTSAIAFVLVQSVLWPVALSAHSGFRAVPETLRMAGRNYGLSGVRFVWKILVPAALPSILSGLRIGWAFAWRTLISAELIFGVTSGSGGLGWFIYAAKNRLLTADVFAGLLTVIMIGVFVESIVFAGIEERTVKRWGMQR
jgi:NitT/TauT family transport system permease protein